mmetsp:Transcript_44403/g.106975  ORF Transcript_44403/g.106975 Transcript_44403/m.106975 type:complete len:443 (-) Transcript_44403:28-1356(-)
MKGSLTGALANAMNSVFDEGFTTLLHQGCLGPNATHPDISVCRYKSTPKWPITLLVGEGKKTTGYLRNDTRGQLFNELLRHRSIEFNLNKGTDSYYYGPILLLAFDKRQIEIDLAFPSTKDGRLECDGAVSFDCIHRNTEAFWTVRLLRISIFEEHGQTNLPIVLHFLSSALEQLDSWQENESSRVQFKIPMPLSINDKEIEEAEYYNENVSKLRLRNGSVLVFKEYCYNLRQEDSVNQLLMRIVQISEEDQRRPPPDDLLACLGPPYSTWKVHRKPFGSVLQYDFIQGSSIRPTVRGWIQILVQISEMHKAGYVHGDLLPRNVLFSGNENGFVIDFDLSRKESQPYVQKFNWEDFKEFRHDDARPCKPMKKIHDIHSLCRMSCYFFDLNNHPMPDDGDLEGLVEFFRTNGDVVVVNEVDAGDSSPGGKHPCGTCTCSPNRY